MIDFNDEKYKPNFVMKLGYFISTVGLFYKTGGIKSIYTYFKANMKLYTYKWKYNHCKKFRNKLQTEARKNGEYAEILLDHIMTGTPIDLEKMCNQKSIIK